MAMTKKDYELVASAINSALKNNVNIIDVLADSFRATNPRFNNDTFVEACLKDWTPEPELSDIIVGGIYELKFTSPSDFSWVKRAKHVKVVEIDACSDDFTVHVESIDGEEDRDWINHSQLGKMVGKV